MGQEQATVAVHSRSKAIILRKDGGYNVAAYDDGDPLIQWVKDAVKAGGVYYAVVIMDINGEVIYEYTPPA